MINICNLWISIYACKNILIINLLWIYMYITVIESISKYTCLFKVGIHKAIMYTFIKKKLNFISVSDKYPEISNFLTLTTIEYYFYKNQGYFNNVYLKYNKTIE